MPDEMSIQAVSAPLKTAFGLAGGAAGASAEAAAAGAAGAAAGAAASGDFWASTATAAAGAASLFSSAMAGMLLRPANRTIVIIVRECLSFMVCLLYLYILVC